METVKFSSLHPGNFINFDGEIITKEQAEALIKSGARPTLYTVSDQYIQEALAALSEARKDDREAGDYKGEDKHAKRILYFPLRYCPTCGINYIGLKRHNGKDYCCSSSHHGTRIGLSEWPHERVELVSSSYKDGGLYSGNTGSVINVKSSLLPSGHIEIGLRVEWDNGAETCWIAAEDFTEA